MSKRQGYALLAALSVSAFGVWSLLGLFASPQRDTQLVAASAPQPHSAPEIQDHHIQPSPLESPVANPTMSHSTVQPGPDGIAQELMHYGPDERHTLQARWRPQGPLRAAVVLVHGGYWTQGGRWQVRQLAQQLNQSGYATFTVHYRFNTQAVWPAQRDDLDAAVGYITEHASRYGIDAQRIALVGFSAGAHLVLSQGLHNSDHPVAAVAAFSAPADPWQAWMDGKHSSHPAQRKLQLNAELLAGCLPPASVRELLRLGPTGQWCADLQWRDANPSTHISPDDPPTLVIHSDEEFVNPEAARMLISRLQRVGVAAQSVLLPGDAHSIHLLDNPAAHQALLDFLHRHTTSPPSASAAPSSQLHHPVLEHDYQDFTALEEGSATGNTEATPF